MCLLGDCDLGLGFKSSSVDELAELMYFCRACIREGLIFPGSDCRLWTSDGCFAAVTTPMSTKSSWTTLWRGPFNFWRPCGRMGDTRCSGTKSCSPRCGILPSICKLTARFRGTAAPGDRKLGCASPTADLCWADVERPFNVFRSSVMSLSLTSLSFTGSDEEELLGLEVFVLMLSLLAISSVRLPCLGLLIEVFCKKTTSLPNYIFRNIYHQIPIRTYRPVIYCSFLTNRWPTSEQTITTTTFPFTTIHFAFYHLASSYFTRGNPNSGYILFCNKWLYLLSLNCVLIPINHVRHHIKRLKLLEKTVHLFTKLDLLQQCRAD